MVLNAHKKSPPWIAGRPVATPDDIDDPSIVKASGVVQLPFHLAWSDQELTYDLDDQSDRRRLYERVLTEGLDADVCLYVRLDELLAMWETIWLSPHVREAWQLWLDRRGITVQC